MEGFTNSMTRSDVFGDHDETIHVGGDNLPEPIGIKVISLDKVCMLFKNKE